jgi:hypothetical protein
MSNNTDNSDSIKVGSKEAMLAALEQTLGIVTAASKLAGIHRDTHYEWMKKDQSYAAKVEALEGIAIDFAESKLHGSIKSGNVTAIIFFLKTKGRDRGYIERLETVARTITVGFDD